MTTTKVTGKGQITLPAKHRTEPGLHQGDDVLFHEADGNVVIESARNAVRELAGSLSEYAKGKPPLTDEIIDQAVNQGIAEGYRRKLADSE